LTLSEAQVNYVEKTLNPARIISADYKTRFAWNNLSRICSILVKQEKNNPLKNPINLLVSISLQPQIQHEKPKILNF